MWQIPGFEADHVRVGTNDTFSLTANVVRYEPVYVLTPITFSALAVNITTADAGDNIRFGIYEATVDWQPSASSLGTPIYDSGNISSATTGVKIATPGTPIMLPVGRYVMFIYTSASPDVRVGRGGDRYVGYDINLSTNLLVEGLTATKNFAASPPTTVTPYTAVPVSTNGFAHSVFMRISVP